MPRSRANKSKTRYSIKRSRGKKATQFKPGNKQYLLNKSRSVPEFEPLDGTSDSTTQPITRITRLTAQEAADISNIRGSYEPDTTGPNQLPYRLRPKPGQVDTKRIGSEIDEHFIISSKHISVLLGHLHSTTCKKSNIQVEATERKGLCVKLTVRCEFCGYKSPELPMSGTVKSSVKGPSAGILNKMFALSVMKPKISIEAARRVLTCLNIKPPCVSTVQKCLDSVASETEQINNKVIEENCSIKSM